MVHEEVNKIKADKEAKRSEGKGGGERRIGLRHRQAENGRIPYRRLLRKDRFGADKSIRKLFTLRALKVRAIRAQHLLALQCGQAHEARRPKGHGTLTSVARTGLTRRVGVGWGGVLSEEGSKKGG